MGIFRRAIDFARNRRLGERAAGMGGAIATTIGNVLSGRQVNVPAGASVWTSPAAIAFYRKAIAGFVVGLIASASSTFNADFSWAQEFLIDLGVSLVIGTAVYLFPNARPAPSTTEPQAGN